MTGLAAESSALLAPVAIGEFVMKPRCAGSTGDSLRPVGAHDHNILKRSVVLASFSSSALSTLVRKL